jgi:hypothetical protein
MTNVLQYWLHCCAGIWDIRVQEREESHGGALQQLFGGLREDTINLLIYVSSIAQTVGTTAVYIWREY